MLYLTIAEQLQLPIYGLTLPTHMLVVWKDENTEIYWETTEGQVRSKAFYVEKYAIAAEQVGENMILNPLKKKDLLAVICFNIGKAYSDKNIFEEAIRYTRQAIELRKDWSNPYSTMATVYRNMELPENALYYSNQALQRFDKDIESYKTMTWAYTFLGCNTEAEEAFGRYLELQ
ncbi:MAG: transglutaminase family protein [Chitinophagales bacterium]